MARKKSTDEPETPAEQQNELPQVETPQEAVVPPNSEEKRKPLISYRLNSDRTTSIELAIWSNLFRNAADEEYEQLSITIQRSYKTDDGWQKGGSYRVHDVPVLMFLMEKAHAFALDRRTTDSTIPF